MTIDAPTQYLLDEYDHIAEAHFKTMDTLSTFFKHYLLIMSVPITIVVGLLSFPGTVDGALSCVAGSFLLAVIALVGGCVYLYLVNLRMDVVLYARTINALRRYFYDRLNEPAQTVVETSVLPRTASVPKYHEVSYFYPIVAAFFLVDTSYLLTALMLGFLGWRVAPQPSGSAPVAWGQLLAGAARDHWLWFAFAVALSGTFHFLGYWLYAGFREGRYLRRRGIGVDVDGVVNNHREMFCKCLKRQTGKDVDPDSITVIPVHECPELGVEREDEIRVFNDPDYWRNMPPATGAAEALSTIRNDLGYEIHIFSRRDWPKTHGLPVKERAEVDAAWCEAGVARRLGEPAIDWITRHWLDEHHFPKRHLVVEKDGGQATRGEDRYVKARRLGLRVFVEDNPANAVRLASTCDLVLLVKHPYNDNVVALPRNVVQVAGWDEVLNMVSRLP